MQKFSIPKRLNLLIIIFLFIFCGDPENPFENLDDLDNVKIAVTIPPRTDSYLWGVGDTVPVHITVSYLNLIDSIRALFGEGDSIPDNDTLFPVASEVQSDTILQLLHIFSTIGLKNVKAFAYLNDGKTCLNDSDNINMGIKPAIDTLINSGEAVVGLPYYMCVKASGTPVLQYSWYKNGTVLPQDTGDTLLFNLLQMSDSGSYYCVVKSNWGSATSSFANLSVAPRFSVTYDGNTATGGTVPIDSAFYKAGDIVDVPGNTGNLVKTGYTFAGWNTAADGSGTTYMEGSSFAMPTADIVLYAKWTNNPTYTVTYDGNGNTSGIVPIDANNYEAGATVIVKENSGSLAKTGFTFSGWNTKSDGSGTAYASGSTFLMDSANVILYAKWTNGPTYTVTYNGNGNTSGSVPIDNNNYETGATVTVKNNSGLLAKTGYTFSGWNTKENGTGTTYAAGSDFTIGSKNVILYAKWTNNPTYTVTYDGNGNTSGSVPIDNNNYETGATVTVKNNSGLLDKTGYTFSGWNTKDDGTGTSFTGGDIFTIDTVDVNLYAKWDSYSYTITFNGQGATVDPNPTSKTVISPATTVGTLPTSPSKTGYIFGGWYTAINGGGTEFTASTVVTANDTVYAKWISYSYTIIFDGQGATVDPNPTSKTVISPATTVGTLPTVPSKTDFIFSGWYTEVNGGGTEFTASTVVTASDTVYAKWTPTYSVTYSGNAPTSGTVPVDTKYYLQGETVTVKGNTGGLTKTGCTFAGWNTANNGSGVTYTAGSGTFNMGSENVTLYAKWVVQDEDGNIYNTVTIGTQTWMVENLKTTKFNDGAAISLVMDSAAWDALTTPAYCWYNNDTNNVKYGALYNWYAVNTGKLSPTGWHVPTGADWDMLQDYLIANGYNWDGTTSENKIAKSLAAKTDWTTSSNPGAIGNDLTKNNKSGFSALPGGYRRGDGGFYYINNDGRLWCSNESDPTNGYTRHLYHNDQGLYSIYDIKKTGFSVRLIRD